MHINEATSIQPVVAGLFATSSGRVGSSLAIVVGLTGIVIGGRALARSSGRSRSDTHIGATDGRGRAPVAMVLGLLSVTVGGLTVATADGGVGSGDGIAGSVVAIVLGLVAIVLGGLARARTQEVA
jgi:hypothetical protein